MHEAKVFICMKQKRPVAVVLWLGKLFHHLLCSSPCALLHGSFSPFHIMCCFAPAQMFVCPLGEPGLLRRVVLTSVCASAQVVRNHTGCFAWREQDSSWQEQEPERVGVRQGCSFQWQSGPEALMGLLCQLTQSFPVLNLVQSGNARYCRVVTASEFLPFEITSTKCTVSETFVAIYSNYVEGSVTEEVCSY